MLFGLSASVLAQIGKPIVTGLISAIRGRKKDQILQAFALVHNEEAEAILKTLIEQLDAAIADGDGNPITEPIPIHPADIRLLSGQIAMAARAADRAGDILRGWNDDEEPKE